MKTVSRYPFSVSLLHWLLAIALIANFAIGWVLEDQEQLLALHRSLGVLVLGLAAIRLLNRIRLNRRLPASVNSAGTPAYKVEKATHFLLYALMLAIPLLGWLKTNAAGRPVDVFGLFSLPMLMPRSHEFAYWLGQLHALTAYTLAMLVGLHVLGAMAHWVFKSENLIPRILPLPERTQRVRHVSEPIKRKAAVR